MNEDHRFDYQVDLTIEDIRLLSHCVNETIRLWPGAPEDLWKSKNIFNI